ncbi:MAG: hypothetical protein ACI8QI_001707 [Limisphaerales bacterium]|jgi:hypothetical protein
MQLHRNVEDARVTFAVNVLTTESGVKIAEDAHSSTGKLGEVALCACFLS